MNFFVRSTDNTVFAYFLDGFSIGISAIKL